ncbi:MAG: replication initiation factor domain-containing protein [Nitrospira sp.]
MEWPFTLSIDWLAFTVRVVTPREVMEAVGGQWSRAKGGFRGYPVSWIRQDGVRGVGKLGSGARGRPGETHVDLSGGIVGAQALDQVQSPLKWIQEKQGHVTRIDCALDDRQGKVSVAMVRKAIDAGQCVTRAGQVRDMGSRLIHGTRAVTGETLYVGSPRSQTLLRIYDKRLELQSAEREDAEEYGVRWELQLKKDRAQVCAQVLTHLEQADWREFLIGVLRSYVDFRDVTLDACDEERYRAPLLPWWSELTEGFQKGRLVIQKKEQTLRGVKQWVSDSLTPMLAVICATEGGESWLMNEIVAGVSRWKDRHRNLLKKRHKRSSSNAAGGHAGAPL